MKRIISSIIAIMILHVSVTDAASKKTVNCAMQGLKDNLLFDVSEKPEVLPSLDFPYPIKTTIFYLTSNNLVLVAMDAEDKTRVRVMISAQYQKNMLSYKGQYITDYGGNQMQLDNGQVSCEVD